MKLTVALIVRRFGVAAIILMTAAAAPETGGIDGNALLRKVAELHPVPRSYSVPIHFRVHLRRPLGFRTGANVMLYFRSPGQQALVITSLPRFLARRLEGNYSHVETVPQLWWTKYRVDRVREVDFNGQPAYELSATPTTGGDVAQAVFDLLRSDLSAVGAQWLFHDGSKVQLAVRNTHVGPYLLPATENLSVDMPHLAFDATGDTGKYTLDQPIPNDVFSQ